MGKCMFEIHTVIITLNNKYVCKRSCFSISTSSKYKLQSPSILLSSQTAQRNQDVKLIFLTLKPSIFRN